MAAAGQALIVGFGPKGIIGPLVAVWAWMALMAVEFGCPAWLKARPVPYLVSHMAIMPLIDLLITACEWGGRGEMPVGLWPFLLLSFANGCVLELGRKIWSPDAERAGVETYSRLGGARRAVSVWLGAVIFAGGLTITTGMFAGVGELIAVCTLAAGVGVARAGWRFIQAPTPAHQAAVEKMAGVWVLVSYLALGFIPLAMRGAG
jgi:4-hydroxybenzoate polyprenyltransferase